MLFFAFVHWNFHQRKLFKVINKTFINESYLKLLLTILVKDCDLKSTLYTIFFNETLDKQNNNYWNLPLHPSKTDAETII